MARVVVVGGGFAGLSAAARLAKLRHDVTLIEASDRLGGRLRGHEIGGMPWPLDPPTVTLPGVLRDLFRKSGRPLERVVALVHAEPRRHVFRDGTVIDLPFGDRAAQHDALVAAVGADEWSTWVDAWNDRWDLLRRTWLDQVPHGRDDLDRAARRTLDVRRSVARVDRGLRDDRLAKLVQDPLRLEGQDHRTTPAFTAVSHYVERTFGRWRVDGGLDALADALAVRLGERRVDVVLGERGVDVVRSGRTVVGVVTDLRTIDADLVVWCAPGPPVDSPGLPVIPVCRTLLRLDPAADLPRDVVVHGNPPARLFTDGGDRWTVLHHAGEDPLLAMARGGLDLRAHVVDDPITLAPADLVRLGHWGWAWQGWRSVDTWPGVAPKDGLFLAGAHAWSGGTIEQIGMATAAIATAIGPVPR